MHAVRNNSNLHFLKQHTDDDDDYDDDDDDDYDDDDDDDDDDDVWCGVVTIVNTNLLCIPKMLFLIKKCSVQFHSLSLSHTVGIVRLLSTLCTVSDLKGEGGRLLDTGRLQGTLRYYRFELLELLSSGHIVKAVSNT